MELVQGKVQTRSPLDILNKAMLFSHIVVNSMSNLSGYVLYVSVERVMQRLELSSMFAYVIGMTPRDVPYLHGSTYSGILWMFIPRIVYPGKPQFSMGNSYGHLYGLLDNNDYTTSVNFPQMIEMYANFGIIGLILGMFLLSQIYRFLSYLLNDRQAD